MSERTDRIRWRFEEACRAFQRDKRTIVRQLRWLGEDQRQLAVQSLIADAFNRGAEEAMRMLAEEVEGEVDPECSMRVRVTGASDGEG